MNSKIISPKVSIIVPVYNVEKYLSQCLDSLINQTIEDIEIICVNDGSTDNSPSILDNYSEKDSRIRVINKKNGGQASARNAGIKLAKGEYIGFVDSDDWVDLQMYETLYKTAKEGGIDLSICSVNIFDEITGEISASPFFDISDLIKNKKLFSYKDAPNFVLNRYFAPWTKLIKNQLLKQNNILFPEGLLFEDIPFHIETLIKTEKISYTKTPLYFYRSNRPGSTMTTAFRNKKIFDITKIFDIVTNIMDDKVYDKSLIDCYERFLIEQSINFLSGVKKNNSRRLYKEIRRHVVNLNLDNPQLDEVRRNFILSLRSSKNFEIFILKAKLKQLVRYGIS